MKRIDLPTLRAAWWTLRAVRRAHAELPKKGVGPVDLPKVPNVGDPAGRGVLAVLNRRSDTCLVRATVLQAWAAAHGRPRDIIIGVTSPKEGFRAHAWLDGDPPCHDEGFLELTRRSPG